MWFSISSSEAKTIRQSGQTARENPIRISYLQNTNYRYSVVVSKKQGTAPQRNYVKRCIRDIMQRNTQNFPSGSYLVFFTGHCSAYDRTYCEKSIATIMKKIIHKTNESTVSG